MLDLDARGQLHKVLHIIDLLLAFGVFCWL